MEALTIHEAAGAAGWSPRMLRYLETCGLIAPRRSRAGYRLYGPAELERLRSLRDLVARFDVGLGEIGFALRLRRDPDLASAVEAWLAAEPEPAPAPPARRDDAPAAGWLRWEQDKHAKLLAAAGRHRTAV